MSLLIHATVTITGEKVALGECEARLRLLLSSQFLKYEVTERYARYDLALSSAHVRSARPHRMRADAGEGRPLIHSTLGPEELWVKDLVLATWALNDEA